VSEQHLLALCLLATFLFTSSPTQSVSQSVSRHCCHLIKMATHQRIVASVVFQKKSICAERDQSCTHGGFIEGANLARLIQHYHTVPHRTVLVWQVWDAPPSNAPLFAEPLGWLVASRSCLLCETWDCCEVESPTYSSRCCRVACMHKVRSTEVRVWDNDHPIFGSCSVASLPLFASFRVNNNRDFAHGEEEWTTSVIGKK